jgi:serine/threonine-protein kinase
MTPGTKLGPYEIIAPIGAGGMGEVYKARDTRLGRDVAIKVSNENFSDRFEREARSIAALNHPNICHLYDVGPNYLVMELIDGTPLKGPLNLETALEYAKQIADALEAAHERGIVHRDLKPGNILITSGGVIKVLDFGLAKSAEAPAGNPESSPTMTISPTRAGMIIGTAAYMAPEQARGKAVDKRADIWAFGCVLYEILTGREPFHGETVSDLLAAVLKEPPNLERVPAHLRPVIEKCLRKDPKTRWRDIGDVRTALEEAKPESAARPVRSAKLPWVLAGALALASMTLSVLLWRSMAPTDKPLMRVSIDLGPDALAMFGPRTTAVISPDASRLAFIVRSGGKQVLATRRLDQQNATVFPGTENALDPFFSPDSQWIGFIADGKMKKINVQGGAPITLCDTTDARGASWGDDGSIIFTESSIVGLSRVSENGGVPQTLTTPAQGEFSHRWPQILPGGQAVLFTSAASPGDFENGFIGVLFLKTGKWKIIQRGGYFGRYLPTSRTGGDLLYVHQGTLFGRPFDLSRYEVQGATAPLVENLAASGGNYGSGNFSFSRNGVFVYSSGGGSEGSPLALIEAGGKTQQLLPSAAYTSARFSPDGKRIAVSKAGDIYVYDRERDRIAQVTASLNHVLPVWAADGKHIVFRHTDQSGYALQWIRADGAGQAQTLIEGAGLMNASSFSRDGKYLAYAVTRGAQQDILVLPLDLRDPEHPHPGKPIEIAAGPASEVTPAFSPDGKWIAYGSFETGRVEVYVCPFPPPADGSSGSRTQISANGGQNPAWSRTELFFNTPNGDLMVASYKISGSSFEADKPRLWSNARIIPGAALAWSFDLAADGRHVMALVNPGAIGDHPASVHFDILLNFFDEVRRRVPEAK